MWSEPILHVDMDSFFVEVERLEDPGLRGRPVAVGGTGPRGVIASASYEARARGVRSAQPSATAARLCPDLVLVPPSHRKYGEKSVEVFAVFRSITPLVEGLSVDEAFLDVSGLGRHFDSPVDVGHHVRSAVRAETGLPCSVGVAATKFVAKLASEAAKPDGLFHVPRSTELGFLHALPADSMWGVGPATMAGLKRLGVETIGDISEVGEASLVAVTGPTVGRRLLELARGIDTRAVDPASTAKSLSVEQTYDEDLRGRATIEASILAHAQKLSMRLRRGGVAARTVGVKVRYDDFTTITRSRTLPEPVTAPRDLYRVAVDLIDDVDLGRSIRLLGLTASNLEVSSARQLEFDGDERRQLDEAVARVREVFGDEAIGPASLSQARGPTGRDQGDD